MIPVCRRSRARSWRARPNALARGLTWPRPGASGRSAERQLVSPHRPRPDSSCVTGGARERQEHAGPGAGAGGSRARRTGGHSRGSVLAVLGRRDPRRPDPHERPALRSGIFIRPNGDAPAPWAALPRRAEPRRPHGRRRTDLVLSRPSASGRTGRRDAPAHSVLVVSVPGLGDDVAGAQGGCARDQPTCTSSPRPIATAPTGPSGSCAPCSP